MRSYPAIIAIGVCRYKSAWISVEVGCYKSRCISCGTTLGLITESQILNLSVGIRCIIHDLSLGSCLQQNSVHRAAKDATDRRSCTHTNIVIPKHFLYALMLSSLQ